MNGKAKTIISLVLCASLLTGCWDRTELNDLALELAWGLDSANGNNIEVSTQIIIPSKLAGSTQGGGGTKGSPFFVESAVGKSNLDASQKIQTKLSRQLFRGQRRVIVVGEDLARSGLKNLLDTYTRDPLVRWRTDVLVVKGDTAKQFLKSSYPLENIPAIGAAKEHEQIGVEAQVTFLKFLLATVTDGLRPTLPAISIKKGIPSNEEEGADQTNSSGAKGFEIVGTAVFNKDLKLLGFLNFKEKLVYHWVRGDLEKQILTGHLPNGQGYFNAELVRMNSKIRTSIKGKKIHVFVFLNGKGRIRENNTSLDLSQSKNLATLEKIFETETENRTTQTIQRVQKEFSSDIFGFGEAIHRQHPVEWQSLKKSWDKEFSNIEVTVKTKIILRRVGLTGPPAQLNENEIKK